MLVHLLRHIPQWANITDGFFPPCFLLAGDVSRADDARVRVHEEESEDLAVAGFAWVNEAEGLHAVLVDLRLSLDGDGKYCSRSAVMETRGRCMAFHESLQGRASLALNIKKLKSRLTFGKVTSRPDYRGMCEPLPLMTTASRKYLGHDLANLLYRRTFVLEPIDCFHGPMVALMIW